MNLQADDSVYRGLLSGPEAEKYVAVHLPPEPEPPKVEVRYKHKKAFTRRGWRIEPVKRRGDVGRNDPCPCGSGKKSKRCCAR